MHICYLVIFSHQGIPIFWQPQHFISSNIRFLSIGYSFLETWKKLSQSNLRSACRAGIAHLVVRRTHNPGFWSPKMLVYVCKYVDLKKFGCHTGQEEVSRCQTRGESGIYCTQVTNHASEDPTWLPSQMLPSVQNSGKSDPTKSTDVLQKCFKMLRSACKLHLTSFLFSSSYELPGLFQSFCYFSLTFSPGSKMHNYCIYHFKLKLSN